MLWLFYSAVGEINF